MDTVDLAAQVHAELLRRELTIAVAESVTGGDLCGMLTAAPGASATVLGGVVSYATAVKQQVLGVPDEVVASHGVVSAQCAEAMAAGVRRLVGSDWALATTGVAGPDSQEGKPVGTVFVGIAGPSLVRSVELSLSGERPDIRLQACAEAMKGLLHELC
ncbi:MAG TPA: nicotinamide-nucleotide amidohydrolase family protein [Marmoricola sp.]|nr:nicotinamide-nucleotide amidohydrolase family protein [Marmoricola sp.]